MTTEELSITEVAWGDHRIRLIELDGGKYIPVGDLAKATGVRKRTLMKVLGKNPEFEKNTRDAQMGSASGSQTTRCIDLAGAYQLLTRISTNHIKSDDTRAKLVEFNQWVMNRAAGQITLLESSLPAPKEKEPEKKKPDFDHIWSELQFVKKLAKETGWGLNELRIAALRDHGLYSLAMVGEKAKPAEPLIALPAPKPKVKDYMTATDIGELCGMSAQQINKFLYNNQYIIKDDAYDWRMTELGREYGEERVLEPSTGILVITCYWKPAILEKMNIRVKG
jgi:hypothetical protein